MSDYAQGPEVVAAAPATSGLADNAAAALAYLTIIPAILFLVLEPYNRKPFIRFHAFQCIALSVVGFVGSMLIVIPIIGWLIDLVLFPVLFVCWLLCVINAYQGKLFKLPILGAFVENLAK